MVRLFRARWLRCENIWGSGVRLRFVPLRGAAAFGVSSVGPLRALTILLMMRTNCTTIPKRVPEYEYFAAPDAELFLLSLSRML